MGLLGTLADDPGELSSEGENVQIDHSIIQGRSDQETKQCDQKTELCEQCYPTMMVLEPTRTPIHCATIRGSKKKSLHVKVVVKRKHLDTLVDTGATASFVQLGVIKKLGLEGKVENCDGSVRFGNGEVERMVGRIQLLLEVEGESFLMDAYVLKGKGLGLILGFLFLDEH